MTASTAICALGAALATLVPTRAMAGGDAGLLFQDDVESGDLSGWTASYAAGGNSVSADPSAAHRGNYGVRIEDDAGGTGMGDENNLRASFPTQGAAVYLRGWFRFAATTTVPSVDVVSFLTPGGHTIAAMHLLFGDGGASLAVGGIEAGDAGGTAWTLDASPKAASEGPWTLLEVAVAGMGTEAGVRNFWLDGSPGLASAPALRSWPADAGWAVDHVQLGELIVDRGFTGSMDFDDVRIGTSPPPSHLGLAASRSVILGHCARVDVQLLDSVDGGLAPAPYDVVASVALSGAGNLFAESGCTGAPQSLLAVTVPTGETAAGFYVSALGASGFSLTASHPDFLSSAQESPTVTGAPAALAFPDPAPVATTGACSPPVVLDIRDDGGNQVTPDAPIDISLTAAAPLYADSSCTTPASTISLGPGQSQAQLYFIAADAGTFTVFATSPGLDPASQREQVAGPVLVASATEVDPGATVTLDASGSVASAGAQVLNWRWALHLGPTGVALTDAPTQTVQLTVPGAYRFAMSFVDSSGFTSPELGVQVTVRGAVPAAPSILHGCGAVDDPAPWLGLVVLLGLAWRRPPRGLPTPGASCVDQPRPTGRHP